MHRTEDSTAPPLSLLRQPPSPYFYLLSLPLPFPNQTLFSGPLLDRSLFPYCDTSYIQSLHRGREFPSRRMPCPWQWWPRRLRNDNPLHIYGEAGKENQADTRSTDRWQTQELRRSIISIITRVKQYYNSSLKSSSSNTYLFVSDEKAEAETWRVMGTTADAFRFC